MVLLRGGLLLVLGVLASWPFWLASIAAVTGAGAIVREDRDQDIRSSSENMSRTIVNVSRTIVTIHRAVDYGEVVDTGRLNSCALVRSDGSLVGAERGNQIDAHDTVIRVNRLPTDEWVRDFGNRTDVLYMTSANQFAWEGYALEMRTASNAKSKKVNFLARMQAGNPVRCNSREDWTSGRCRFKSLVMRDVPDEGGGYGTRLADLENTWDSAPIPLGISREEIATYAYKFLKAFGGFRKSTFDTDCGPHCAQQRTVSSAFMAMLTFAPLCETLDLYGFGSVPSPMADIQLKREDKHDYVQEYALLDHIVGGTVAELDLWKEMPSDATQWLKDNLLERLGRIRKVE